MSVEYSRTVGASISLLRGSLKRRVWKDGKSQRPGRTGVKLYLLAMTRNFTVMNLQLLWLPARDLYKAKPVDISE